MIMITDTAPTTIEKRSTNFLASVEIALLETPALLPHVTAPVLVPKFAPELTELPVVEHVGLVGAAAA
jgi:hypothetical protein